MQTSSLPTELSQNILLQVDPPTLVSLCGTSLEYRSLCSDSRFWRARFEEEGLPLLEQGWDANSWIRIYQKSLRVAQLVEDYLEENSESISLEQVNLDELQKIAPWFTDIYYREEEEKQDLIQEREALLKQGADIDDIESTILSYDEYSLRVVYTDGLYYLDVVTGDYNGRSLLYGITGDEAFDVLFRLLY